MGSPLRQPTPSRALSVLAFVAVVAALSLARDFFIPLALAILVSFLLAPVSRQLEKWRFHRVVAVLAAVALAFSVVAGVGWIVAGQVVDLANKLPQYKTTISAKLDALRRPRHGALSHAAETINELSKEMSEPAAPASVPPKRASNAMPVKVVDAPSNAFELIKSLLSQVISTLGTGAIVVVCVIFFLLEREDIRDRLIHVAGKSRLHATTQALTDAGTRVSRYLLTQLVVNVAYGIPIAAGLFFIGVPNAILWGLLCAILRFVPYLGATLAAAFPILISVAVFDHWMQTAMTVGLFIVVEMIVANLVEPWLYGASTGLSPTAIIVAAVFWTWLWGSVGLLLSTPLTVCLAVAGKYIPHLGFLEILLGDKPAMPPADRFYQRLASMREEEAAKIAQEYREKHSLAEVYDTILAPALARAERDVQIGDLDEAGEDFIHRAVRELVEEFGAAEMAGRSPDQGGIRRSERKVLCLPATDEADEIVALMLVQLLMIDGYSAEALSAKTLASEALGEIRAREPALVCISSLPRLGIAQARYLVKRVEMELPAVKIVTGIWHATAERRARIGTSLGGTVVITLREALEQIKPLAECAPAPGTVVTKKVRSVLNVPLESAPQP